jgi:pyruvate/2-oxoglutarate dehydrogenase complex dihydrolipoamide acyltransferase (E2) component
LVCGYPSQVSNGTHNYPASWSTPAGNAAEAVTKYKDAGNSFLPWGTYTSGAYKQFLSGSVTPDTNVPSSGAAASSSSASTAASSASSSSDPGCLLGIPPIDLKVFSTPEICLFRKSWARALLGGSLMLAGGVLATVGVLQLLKITTGFSPSMPGGSAGKAVEKSAEKAAPQPPAAPSAPKPPPRQKTDEELEEARQRRNAQARARRAARKPASTRRGTYVVPGGGMTIAEALNTVKSVAEVAPEAAIAA